MTMIVLKGISQTLSSFFSQNYVLDRYHQTFTWDENKITDYLTSIFQRFRIAPLSDYTLGYVLLIDQRIIDGNHRVTILSNLLQTLYPFWVRQSGQMVMHNVEHFPSLIHLTIAQKPSSTDITTINSTIPLDLQALIKHIIEQQLAEDHYTLFVEWLFTHGILIVV